MSFGEVFKELSRDGFDLKICIEPDYDQDTSWLGEFSEMSYKDGRDGIPVDPVSTRSGYLFRSDRQTYFYPQEGCEENAALDEERLRDYYLEYWCPVTVAVHAYKAGIKLGSDYLSGVESDSDFDDVVQLHGMVNEAIFAARATLEELCGCDHA